MGVTINDSGLLYEDANLKVILDWNMVTLGGAVQGATQQASIEAAQAILEDANTMVPFDTGLLHDTGTVTPVPGQGTSGAIVSYSTIYAAHLHEHPEFHFQNGREGKWLEKAMARSQAKVMSAMMSAISKSFTGVPAVDL